MENPNPLAINATLIFVFFSFAVFIFLMHLICYRPIMMIIKEREKLLYKNKETVDTTNKKTEKVKEEIASELSKAKFESSKMLKDAIDLNKAEKNTALQNKKLELSKEIQAFEEDLETESSSVKKQLKSEISDYVKSTVSKILNVNPDEVNINESKLDEILK